MLFSSPLKTLKLENYGLLLTIFKKFVRVLTQLMTFDFSSLISSIFLIILSCLKSSSFNLFKTVSPFKLSFSLSSCWKTATSSSSLLTGERPAAPTSPKCMVKVHWFSYSISPWEPFFFLNETFRKQKQKVVTWLILTFSHCISILRECYWIKTSYDFGISNLMLLWFSFCSFNKYNSLFC